MLITLDDGSNVSCALHCRVEIRNLEPEQSTVSQGNLPRCERAVVILDVDLVQLQDELPGTDDLLVLVAPVGALRIEDLCITVRMQGRCG